MIPIIAFMVGGVAGVVIMAILQISRLNDTSMESGFRTLLRGECDGILSVIQADPEQTYDGLADQVASWGLHQFSEGLILGRGENTRGIK